VQLIFILKSVTQRKDSSVAFCCVALQKAMSMAAATGIVADRGNLVDIVLQVLLAALCVHTAARLWVASWQLLIFLALAHEYADAFKYVGGLVAGVLGPALVRWGCVDADPFAREKQVVRWQFQVWQLGVHLVFAVAGAALLAKTTWLEAPDSAWTPQPEPHMYLVLFMLSQLAVWTDTAIRHVLVDERRHDYTLMLLHHVVTLALVSLALFGGMMPAGLVVLFLHDTSDVCIDLLKMASLARVEGRRGGFASEGVYVLCLASWAYFRLYALPQHVLAVARALLPSTVRIFMLGVPAWDVVNELAAELAAAPDTGAILVLLTLLLVMHVYWFQVLLRVGCRIRRGERAHAAGQAEYAEQEPECDQEKED